MRPKMTHLKGKKRTPRGTKTVVQYTRCGQLATDTNIVNGRPLCRVCTDIVNRDHGFQNWG